MTGTFFDGESVASVEQGNIQDAGIHIKPD